MNRYFRFKPILITAFLAITVSTAGCGGQREPATAAGHETTDEQEYERGPHNGRLLRDGNLALEITIFETGVPPEFRVYPYRDSQAVDPASIELSIRLGRLGGRTDDFAFRPQGDFLRGDGVVLEPHSFDVSVIARSGGRESSWRYESYEGRTQIESAVADSMGIEVAQASGERVTESIKLQGGIYPHPDALTEIRGRYPGIVQSLQKTVGDAVRKGETLARIQSNESMQMYTVSAATDGTVIAREGAVGSVSTNGPLYVIADMSRMVADLKVFERDLDRIAVGQTVLVSSINGGKKATGTIDRILPTLDSVSRAATARVLLDDTGPGWRPGHFVTGTVVVEEHDVPLAVRESGLQSFRDFTVVYARVGQTYEVRMLDIGRRDGEFAEVLGGLEPGTTYVSENSYLVKADIEKSGASHDH